MPDSYVLNDKFIKLYLDTPENNKISLLISKTLQKLIKYYNVLDEEEKVWLEEYLSCLIDVKKIMDIPKQLNLFLYSDKLPHIKAKFIKLRDESKPKYEQQLEHLEYIINKELNYYFKATSAHGQNKEGKQNEKSSGFHLTRFN